MPQKLKNPETEPTNEEWRKMFQERRRSNCPYVEVNHTLITSSTIPVFAFIAVANKQAFKTFQVTVRVTLDPSRKSLRDAYNNRPDVAARRGAYYKAKNKEPEYKQARKEENAKLYSENREAILARNNKWEAENKDYVRAYMTKYARNKRQTEPWWNIRNRLASRLWHALAKAKCSGSVKAHKTQELIGCTVAALRDQLESQFTEGMTWEIFLKGEIHIDHRMPCSSFDLTDPAEQKKCFHHTNLQPLWKLDNIRKSDTVPL